MVGTAKLSSDLDIRSQYGILSETTERSSESAVNANRRGTAMTDSCVVMVGDFNHTSLTTVLPKLKQCMV